MSAPARWILVAFLMLFSWMLLFSWSTDPPRSRIISSILVGLMLLFALGLARPQRFTIALRIVAGAVGIAYATYFVSQVWQLFRGEPQPLRPGQPSAILSGVGLLVWGIPALIFALGKVRVGTFKILDRASAKPDDDERSVQRALPQSSARKAHVGAPGTRYLHSIIASVEA